MTASKSYSILKKYLAKQFAAEGFLTAGDIFWRRCNDTLIVLEIQKDSKRSTKDAILFTLDVGICVDALHAQATSELPSIDVPPTSAKCHWRMRMGRLLAQTDKWWRVSDEQTARAACEEIATGFKQDVLPKLLEIASSDALIQLWEKGLGQGLTEYERRSNLAALLCLLRRTDEAKAAILSLENASQGKAWESAAKCTVRELRKALCTE